MDCSTPDLPVYHQLPEFTQTHVHCVYDAIQPSHTLSSPPPPTFNLSQHQGLFKWVSSLHQVAQIRTQLDTMMTLPMFFLFSFKNIYLSVAALGLRLSPFAVIRGCSPLASTRASHCSGFSCCRAQAVGRMGSVVRMRAWLPCCMWNLPGSGIKPVSPASAGDS